MTSPTDVVTTTEDDSWRMAGCDATEFWPKWAARSRAKFCQRNDVKKDFAGEKENKNVPQIVSCQRCSQASRVQL